MKLGIREISKVGPFKRFEYDDPILGVTYMKRTVLIDNKYFVVYINDLLYASSSDDGVPPHTHPWAFCSTVLRGQYIEEVDTLRKGKVINRSTRIHHRFGPRILRRNQAHNISAVAPKTKTFMVGIGKSDFGFVMGDKFVSRRELSHSQVSKKRQ